MSGSSALLAAAVATALARGASGQAIADACSRSGEFAMSRSSASDAVNGAADARAIVAAALVCQSSGRYQEAVRGLTQALARYAFPPEERARVIFDRGVAHDALGQLADAIGDYSAALRLSPRFAAALNNRGNVYRREGRLVLAQRDYRSSLSVDNLAPQYPYFGLGQIAEARGDLALAHAFYDRALRASPGFVPAADRLRDLEAGTEGRSRPIRQPRARAAIAQARPNISRRPSAPVSAIAPAAYEPAESALDLRPAIYGTSSEPEPDERSSAVQLGAWRDEAAAAQGWNRLQSAARDALAGLSPHIVAVDIPGRGRFYRLRARPMSGALSAPNVCRKLQGRGLPCIVVPAG